MLNGIEKPANKAIIVALCLVLMVVILVIALILGGIKLYKEYQKVMERQVEDTNGDSIALCKITDEMIECLEYEYYAIKHRTYSQGLNSSHVNGKHKEYDNSYTKTTMGLFSGVYLCNVYQGTGKNVTYTVYTQLSKGNLRIVITNSNGEILKDIPVDGNGSITFRAEKEQLYFLKYVGESAEVVIEMERVEE